MSVIFNYKKYETLPPGELHFHPLGELPAGYVNQPNWIDIYDVTSDELKIKLNSNVNLLSAGNYNIAIGLLSQSYVNEYSIFVTLNLEETLLLSVSPTALNYSFTIGGTVPASKSFAITSETSWTITKNASWLALSIASGSNNGSCLVTVNPTGLAPGVYNDTISINDGTTTKTVAVSFTISDTASGSDFLNVYPTTLAFGYTQSGTVPTSKSISINASDTYAIVASQAWVSLSAASGPAGNSSIIIGVQNISGLAAGNYEAYVDITVNDVTKRIVVSLVVYAFIEETLTPGDLHYADDNNVIRLSSGRFDTHLQLDLSTNFESKSYQITHLLPYFNGAAQKRIGEEAKKIIAERGVVTLEPSRCVTTYLPLNFTIGIKEVELASNAITSESTLQNILFIKGPAPATNLLSYTPAIVFLTRKGILIFTVLSNGNSVGSIVISGAVTANIASAIPNAQYYTALVSLAEFPALKEGDELIVAFMDQSIKVVIIPETNEQTILLAENQWGFFEAFEFTGSFNETFGFKSESYQFRKDHLYNETRVYETRDQQSFKVDTGFIHSNEMIFQLKNLLKSTNMYLINAGTQLKVNFKGSNLVVKETNRESASFDLTFENVLQ